MIDLFVSPSGPCPRRLRAVMVAVFAAAALFVAGAASAQTGGGQIVAPNLASRLLEAVFNDDLEAAKISIADGADYEARGKLGRTALELAIDLGHFKIAHYFLALRQNRRQRVTRALPPQPAPPPPFVPLQTEPEPAPAPPAPLPPVPAVTVIAPAPPAVTAAATAPPATMPAAPVEAVVATPAPPPPPAPPPEIKAPAVVAVAPPPAAQAPEPSAPASEPAEAAERVATAAPAPPTPVLPAVGLGLSLNLGKVPDAGSGPGAGCVVKRGGKLRICVEEVDWPEAVAEHFVIDAFLYKGTKALVRYEGGVAVRLYAQFPTASFDAVVEYHTRRLGPPSETVERVSTQRGGGTLSNITLVWRLGAPEGGTGAVVEIRRYDDVRRKSSNGRYGVVQIASEGTSEFFSRVSSLDLMRLR